VNRHDRVTGGEQTLDDQAVRTLDGDRQLGRISKVSEPGERPVQARFIVAYRQPSDDRTVVVDHGEVVALAGPVPSGVQASPSVMRTSVGSEAVSRFSLFGLHEASPWRRSWPREPRG
jgi:hypothetical protein